MRDSLQKARLYGICDLGYLSDDRAIPVSRALISSGIGILQLRAKGRNPEDLLELACKLRSICGDAGIPFIVNDHLELARASEAHGLHLGQDDGSLDVAREKLGSGIILGRSTHSLGQARIAHSEGADYIGFGPLFPTPTKQGRPGIGLGDLDKMHQEIGSTIPAFAIGGIKDSNLSEVLAAGARRVVIVSHLLQAADPAQATDQILSTILSAIPLNS